MRSDPTINSSTNPHGPPDPVPTPAPLQYELRIGVAGHRDLADPPAVDRAVRQLLERLVHVFERASAEPLGPHGTPQSRMDRFDRRLTQALAAGTRLVCPVLETLTAVAVAPLRWTGLPAGSRPHWPRVPFSPDRPDASRQTALKLTVITSLAPGSDQIVADAVCDLVRPELRNRYLEAVLPFPQRACEEDFADEQDFACFRRLLALDRGRWNTHPEPTVLFPDFPACPDPENPALPLSREHAWAAATRYVVETSEIVVAIWDPSREQTPDGTARTVRYAIVRGRVVLWLNPADLDAGPFLLTSRREPDAPAGSATAGLISRVRARVARAWRRHWHERPAEAEHAADGRIATRVPGQLLATSVPSRARQLSRNFHRLSAYNRDPGVDDAVLERDLREQAAALDMRAHTHNLPEEAARVVVDALLPHVVRAEHLSERYRRLRNAAAWLWPGAAACVVTLMAFQIIFLPDWYWLAVVELAVLLLGYVSYRVSVYNAWHEKWLNDRRLADGLRGAMFTTLLTTGDEDGADDHRTPPSGTTTRIRDPLPFYNPANAWFVATLKRVLRKERRRFAASLDLEDAGQRRAVASFIRDGWIRDQAADHQRHADDRRRVVVWTRRLRLAGIVMLAIVAILHASGVGHGGAHLGQSVFTRVDLWVALATVALPAWAAALHVMLSLDDHERLAERSALMASLLRGLAEQLEQADTLAHLRECVADAERILDLESREWAESLAGRKPEFTG